MTSGTIARRSFIAAASTGFVAAVSLRGSTASKLLIRSQATVTLVARGATLSGLRAAVQEIACAGVGTLHVEALVGHQYRRSLAKGPATTPRAALFYAI